MDNKTKLEQNYIPYIHKWGKITNALGIFLGFIPLLYLGFVYGWWPQPSHVIAGLIGILGIVGVTYVMQPIQFFPI